MIEEITYKHEYLAFWKVASPVFTLREQEGSERFFSPSNAPKMRLATMLAYQPGTLQFVHGNSGVGKTTWLRTMTQHLDAHKVEVFFSVAHRSQNHPLDLMNELADFLGARKDQKTESSLSQGLEQLREEKRNLLIIIDALDASDHPQVWQDLAVLFDCGSAGGLVPTAILAGSRTSLNMLRQYPTLSERLSFAWEFTPFNTNETLAYIDFCCANAGFSRSPFSVDATEKIAELSSGYVFAINMLAETCLMQAADQRLNEVSIDLVLSLVAQLDNYRQRKPLR